MIVKSCSFSSDKKLARCEMQFKYRYTEGLQAKVKKIGLFRGDIIHQLLEAHYRRIKGGWRAKFVEITLERWNKLFDEEKEMYGVTFMDDIQELMELYFDHWSEWERSWEILHIEKRFELPTKFGFPVRWQADLVVAENIPASTKRRIRGHERKSIVLVETKAKKKIPDSSERILQPQTHGYAWLLGKVGIQIDSILWNYIRTEPIPRPQILKSGSLSERKINTDQVGYLKSLKEAGITPETATDWIGIQNHLKTLPETLAVERIANSVNLKIGEQSVRDWVERHRRALEIKRPLRSWNRNCKFDCDYFDLCQVDMLGKTDRSLVVLRGFTTRGERAEEENPNGK